MLPFYHRNFKKDYGKLSAGMQSRFNERLKLFLNDPFHPLLNKHPLHGEWEGYHSINITGDLRAVYKVEGDTAIFVAIDTHTHLYD